MCSTTTMIIGKLAVLLESSKPEHVREKKEQRMIVRVMQASVLLLLCIFCYAMYTAIVALVG